MKFDDSDEDYFLHDFSASKESAAGQGNEPSPTPARPQTEAGDAPHFDFSDENTGNSVGEQPQPSPRKKRGHGWMWFFVIVALVLAGALTVRYFIPYITESRVTGYVTLVEKRGIVFPTFEGEMISESQLADTSRIYSRDVYFSIPDDEMALRLQQYQGTGRPVTVTFKKYYGTLPWRGASNVVAVDFQPAGNN